MKISVIVLLVCLIQGCTSAKPESRAVFLLLDTSGTYTKELEKAQTIMNYLLATLDAGDSLAMARIDSGSFSEKDIIVKATLDARPSTANQQKRLLKQQVDAFVANTRMGSRYTDISGGVLQATEYLTETGAGEKYVLIFSDLEEDLPTGHLRDFPILLSDVKVIALNVTKLRSDNVDPREYLSRLDSWQQRVQQGGGSWRVINDLENLDKVIAHR